MDHFMTAADELFLLETFGKLVNGDKTKDCLFLSDEDENDIPLSEFLFFENDDSECESPLDTIRLGMTRSISPEFLLPENISEQSNISSPCWSPDSHFPNFPFDYTYTPPPSLSPTSPTTTSFLFENTTLIPPSPDIKEPPHNFEVPPPLQQFDTSPAVSQTTASWLETPPLQTKANQSQPHSQVRPPHSQILTEDATRQSQHQDRTPQTHIHLAPLQKHKSSFKSPESKRHALDCLMQTNYKPPQRDADLSQVHFIDIKEMYEKTQVRRGGISEQRLVDCRVHMMAVFSNNLECISVYVHRFPETVGYENQIELPVILEISLKNTQYFSVNLDAVYLTSFGNRFYQLSTTDRQRKNRFVIKCTLAFADGSSADFTSTPFLIRSRKQSPNPRKKRSHSVDSS